MTKIEKIEEFVLATMKDFNIEDTTENRLAFLKEMQEVWDSSDVVEIETTFYKLALHSMITALELKLMSPPNHGLTKGEACTRLLFFFAYITFGIMRPNLREEDKMSTKKYGLGRFLFDLFMIAITGGLWLIWMIFKFLRSN